jgi:hypothetical protein
MKFKFIASLIMWYNILFEINVISKQLQNKITDMSSAMNCINDTKELIMNIRNDNEFEKLLVEETKVAEILGVPPNFEEEQETVRHRDKKKQFMYEQEDQSISDFKQKFKIGFYFSITDTAIAAVDNKFKHMFVLNENFGVLINIYELQKKLFLRAASKMFNFTNLPYAL